MMMQSREHLLPFLRVSCLSSLHMALIGAAECEHAATSVCGGQCGRSLQEVYCDGRADPVISAHLSQSNWFDLNAHSHDSVMQILCY